MPKAAASGSTEYVVPGIRTPGLATISGSAGPISAMQPGTRVAAIAQPSESKSASQAIAKASALGAPPSATYAAISPTKGSIFDISSVAKGTGTGNVGARGENGSLLVNLELTSCCSCSGLLLDPRLLCYGAPFGDVLLYLLCERAR